MIQYILNLFFYFMIFIFVLPIDNFPQNTWEKLDLKLKIPQKILWHNNSLFTLDLADSLIKKCCTKKNKIIDTLKINNEIQNNCNKILNFSISDSFLYTIHPIAKRVYQNKLSNFFCEGTLLIDSIGSVTDKKWSLKFPYDLIVKKNILYLIDIGLNKILSFSVSSQELLDFEIVGDSLNFPTSIDFDPYSNHIYVADTANRRVVRLIPISKGKWRLESIIAEEEKEKKLLRWPIQIILNRVDQNDSGSISVLFDHTPTDTNIGNCINRYSLDGSFINKILDKNEKKLAYSLAIENSENKKIYYIVVIEKNKNKYIYKKQF